MITAETLPEPDCEYGYPRGQIESMFGKETSLFRAFNSFMHGQTMMLCDGQHPCTVSHGIVCYVSDVKRFVRGQPVID